MRGSQSSHIGRPDLGWPPDLSWGRGWEEVKPIGLISTGEALNAGGGGPAAAAGERLWEGLHGQGFLNSHFGLMLQVCSVVSSYWIRLVSVHAESRDILPIVNIGHSGFRWPATQMLRSQWYPCQGEGRVVSEPPHKWMGCTVPSRYFVQNYLKKKKKIPLIRLDVLCLFLQQFASLSHMLHLSNSVDCCVYWQSLFVPHWSVVEQNLNYNKYCIY